RQTARSPLASRYKPQSQSESGTERSKESKVATTLLLPRSRPADSKAQKSPPRPTPALSRDAPPSAKERYVPDTAQTSSDRSPYRRPKLRAKAKPPEIPRKAPSRDAPTHRIHPPQAPRRQALPASMLSESSKEKAATPAATAHGHTRQIQ